MYSNIQDADEGTRRNLQLEKRTHVFSSAQLLEAISLSRSRPRIPDMGDFTGTRIWSHVYIFLHLVSVNIPQLLFGDQKVRENRSNLWTSRRSFLP